MCCILTDQSLEEVLKVLTINIQHNEVGINSPFINAQGEGKLHVRVVNNAAAPTFIDIELGMEVG